MCAKSLQFSSVQFILVTQSCPTLCDPMNCSTPGLPVYHQLPEFTQTHIHQVTDAIQWQPTPVFLPGESQGQGRLVGSRLWGRTELDTTEAT